MAKSSVGALLSNSLCLINVPSIRERTCPTLHSRRQHPTYRLHRRALSCSNPLRSIGATPSPRSAGEIQHCLVHWRAAHGRRSPGISHTGPASCLIIRGWARLPVLAPSQDARSVLFEYSSDLEQVTESSTPITLIPTSKQLGPSTLFYPQGVRTWL